MLRKRDYNKGKVKLYNKETALYREKYICKRFTIQKVFFFSEAKYAWFFWISLLKHLYTEKYRLQYRVLCGNFSCGFFSPPCTKKGADSGPDPDSVGSEEHQHRPTKKKEKKTGSATASKSGIRIHPKAFIRLRDTEFFDIYRIERDKKRSGEFYSFLAEK
jgi:hypothetical protein